MRQFLVIFWNGETEQSSRHEQFVTRVRDLESKGVLVYDVGSTSAILGEGSAGFEVEELQR